MECTKEYYRFFIVTMQRNGYEPKPIYDMLTTAWGDKAPSLATVYRNFQSDSSTFEDQARSGRPSTSTTPEKANAAKAMIQEDRHMTVDEIAEGLDISHGSAYNILSDILHLRHVCSVWIPHNLDDRQKASQMMAAQEWLYKLQNMDMSTVISVDEKWFYLRSVGSRLTNKVWISHDEKRPQIARRFQSDVKVLVIMAVSYGGHIYYELLNQGETINSGRYITFLQNMHNCFSHKRSSLGWRSSTIIHDNARPHISHETTTFFNKKHASILHQPAYSPDFNLLDRWVFSMLEKKRQRRNFQNRDDLKEFLQSILDNIPKTAFISQGDHLLADLNAVVLASGEYLNT